jgi:hypothetical protein
MIFIEAGDVYHKNGNKVYFEVDAKEKKLWI